MSNNAGWGGGGRREENVGQKMQRAKEHTKGKFEEDSLHDVLLTSRCDDIKYFK